MSSKYQANFYGAFKFNQSLCKNITPSIGLYIYPIGDYCFTDEILKIQPRNPTWISSLPINLPLEPTAARAPHKQTCQKQNAHENVYEIQIFSDFLEFRSKNYPIYPFLNDNMRKSLDFTYVTHLKWP